jgi:purine-binding chemotaxis protein CheW
MRYELITFGVCGQFFAAHVLKIREIRAWSPVTPLPQSPDYVAGMINVRGIVLPVIDLSIWLGWAATDCVARSAIILVEGQDRQYGLIVHDVDNIVTLDAKDLQQPGVALDDRLAGSLEGVATIDGHTAMVLDLTKVIGGDFDLATC